jgi:hypothetical protein
VSTSAAFVLTNSAVLSSASAAFLGTDTTTQGNWRGVYGADGYAVVSDATALPAYATLAPSGQSTYTWAVAGDARALERTTGTGRIVSVWYGNIFTVDVNLTDGASHQMSLYLLDWDWGTRAETVEVRDAGSNALLDSQTMSNFTGGQYWRWTVSGHVTIRVINTGSPNAVMSGVFFDTNTNQPPTVAMTSPAEGATIPAPGTFALAASASDADGIAKVEFYQGSTLIATTTGPYSATWSHVAAGNYTLTAKAYDSLGAATTSAPVHVTVTGAGGPTTAAFLGTDTTTQGNWRGVYGADGYVVVSDATALPTYASVIPSGQSTYTWTLATSDVRGLQKADGTGRLASVWYAHTFNLDVNLVDGASHQVSIYAVDWDWGTRAQTVELRDAATDQLLDSRSTASFVSGLYWKWAVSGHVIIRFVDIGSPNAVVNGVFLDSVP